MKLLAISAVALGLAACAPSVESIQPVSMHGAYAGISCSQAVVERNAAAQRLASLSAAQASAQASDAVGVFIIGLPIGSMTGGNKAGDIAAEKGRIAALDARLVSC